MAAAESYDYIVARLGPAGCVIAARLAEAGNRVWSQTPATILSGRLIASSRIGRSRPTTASRPFTPTPQKIRNCDGISGVRHYTSSAQQQKDWNYRQQWEGEKVDGVLYPRASALGGCAGHNAMITVRPNGADWNHIWQLTGDA